MRQIKTAQQIAIVLDAIGVVNVIVEDEAQNITDAGFDYRL